MNRRPRLTMVHGPAAPAEAAAVIAALEQFMRDTAPPPAADPDPPGWLRTARLEAVRREPDGRDAWGDAHPWR